MEVDNQTRPQKLLNGRYKKIKKLAEGGYGVVYIAEDMKPSDINDPAPNVEMKVDTQGSSWNVMDESANQDHNQVM